MSRRLDVLLREVRDHLGAREIARLDWNAMERSLLSRVESESRGVVPKKRRVRTFEWEAFAATVAFALVVIVVMGKAVPRTNVERSVPPAAAIVAGTVTDLDGEVLVGGVAASQGMSIHVGDVIDAQVGSVIVAHPGKVAFVAERGSRVRVVRGGEATVLALEYGAVEASVEPVGIGEAFAVDVGVSRVAAHGTHLRVARSGDNVTVDLNEGVVSVGRAPRSGEVAGVVVNAPAHAEFVVTTGPDTFLVTHVRAAVRLPVSVIPGAFGRSLPVPATSALVERGVVDTPSPLALPSPSRPGPSRPGPSRPPPGAAALASSTPPLEPFATSASLAMSIRNCLKEEPHPDNVSVAFESTLYLQLGEDGTVRSARFDPPVAPDVNACAAPLIYSARFDGGGALTVPIDFKD